MMPVISGVDGYSNTPVSVKTRSGSFTYGFKSPELPVGTVLSVMVTHVTDPEYFHCQGTKYAAAFGHLADKIHIHYSKLQPEDETLKLISPGQPCVAQYSVDKLWYRAKVNRELSDGAVEVFFVDYGNVEVVARHLIKVTKPDFMEMPAQGILCTLDGISNVHGYWSPEHIAKFEDMVLEQFFTAKVKSFGLNGIHSVELSKEGENFQINLVFGRLTGTLCLEEDSDSSSRSVTVGRDRTNLQVTVESDSRNRRTLPKGRPLTKNAKNRRDGIQDADLLRDDGASSSDSQSFASCASDTSVCYKSYKFPIGSQLDVCMIFLISPHEFWCQPLSMGSKLKTLMKELNDKNSGATRLEFEGIPSSKTPCLAKFSDDRMWYRAEVVEVKQGKAAIFYVDYGNAEILPLSELRVLPLRYADVPTLAVKCCLNLDPKSVWSDSRINRLQELALDKRLSAKVVSRMAGTYMLELYEPNTQKNLVSIVEDKDLLHQLPINNDMNLRVNVSWVTTPDDFWLHMANNERLLKNMVQEMQVYYDAVKEKYTEYPSVGAYVVAQFSEDNAWYRALVEEVFDSKVKVRFVDFGNDEVLSLSNLRPLNPIFGICPCQAVRCRLQDIKPLSIKGWTPDVKDYLENLDGDLICTFKKLVKNVFHVEIREDGQSVAESLVNAGLAAMMDVKPVHTPEMNRQTSLRGGLLNNFKVIEVLPNQVKSVMISYCNGLTDFWCQMAGFTDELNNLMDELAIEYDSSNLRPVSNRHFPVGSPCIAKYSEDDTWYRAVVVEAMTSSYSVQFVDYGNIEEVNPANMRQMTSKFMRLPKLAVPCKLYGIHSSSAPQDVTFTELVFEKTMKAQFLNAHPSDGLYEVNLLQDDGVSVIESLEEFTAAVRSDRKMLGLSNGTLEIPIIPVNQKLAKGHSKIGSVCFAYSPDHFFIHFEEDDDKIDEASEMLNAEYSQDIWTNKCLTHIEQGMICCAKYSVDDQWYRACVLENNGDTVSVCFVDYGNSENLSPQNLRPLLEVFCYMPALAYKFGLAGILPMENEWSQEVCDLFERIVVDETWTIRNMGNNECLLMSDENVSNVLDLLVKSGHARKKDADISTSKDTKTTIQPSSVLLPTKIYFDVIFEKMEDLSQESQSLHDILFIPDVIFPNVDVPSDEIQCCITHLTESLRPGIFYLRLASQDEKYSDLLVTLCNKLTNYSNPVLEVNTICCVYLTEKKSMCRGVITSVDKSVVGLVDVKAIDSGHYLRDVPVSSIRGISDEACTIPPLAYPCVLENCLDWNKRMRSRFHLLTYGHFLTVHFKSTSRPYIVELFDESGNKISDAINGKMTTVNKEDNKDESILKPFHVLQHETLGIYISHIVTPEDFWCQPEESIDLLQKLEKEMSAYCTQGTGKEEMRKYLDDLKPGTLCIVRFTKDDKFYRGKIQSLKRFSCDILFVDYGYTETVEKKSIWPLQSKFLELPAQAFECRLANIQSKDGSWSKNSLEVFQRLCLNQLMIAHVINSLQHPDGTGYVIDLILNQRNVADLLVEQNVAETFSKVELLDNVLVERSVIDAIAEIHFLSSPKVLMKGETFRIQVCHIDSPHKFWVQILTKVPLIERIRTLLGEVYGKLASEPASLTGLKTGMLCAVMNSTRCPYRGCVQNLADDNSTCSVLNIDFGITETVDGWCLKELYPCFMDFSPQAFHCSLSTSDNEFVTEGWTGYLKVDAIAEDGHYLVSLNQDTISASLPMYLQPEYVAGFTVEVIVCFTTDPSNFWCQFTESAGLDYLMGKLKSFFKNDDISRIPESELRVGLPCVARYSEDGALYRAEVLVLDMDSSSAEVMFCDYGNIELLPLLDLKPAPPELLTLPKQAFHCCLSDAVPIIGEEWTEDMCSGFEEIVLEKVFHLSVLSVSNDDKYIVSMKDKNEKCLLEMLTKCGISKNLFSPTEEHANSPNCSSAVELSASDKEMVDTDVISESEEYKDVSQASEEFGSEEFHDALHENDQNSDLKEDRSSDVYNIVAEDLAMSKPASSSVKQSNTVDSGLVADFSSENSPMKTSSDTEDDNVDCSSATTTSHSDDIKDETNKINVPENPKVITANSKHVAALPATTSSELFHSNHNEWEDMNKDLNTELVTNYFSKDPKIENILSRLDGSQSFDLDSTFGDSDTETVSPFAEWPLDTALRLKAVMLHCIGPDHFYLRLCSMAEERVQLFNAIENCLPTLHPAQEKDFLSGSACLAKCSGDAEVWQRGIIQEEENGAIKVFFVDTGKEEKIPKSSVHRCPLSLFSRPVLAVSCFLADIQPLNGSWSTAASELFKELTHNVSLELKAEVRSGGQHGIYLYKEDDDEAINDRFVDLGYAMAESGSKLEVNRELEHSLLDPHRTKHMELSFHDISCCRESCYDDDFDCDTLSHDNSHGHILIEDSIKGPAVITNATRLKQEVTDENDKMLIEERTIETSQKKSEEHWENLEKTDQDEIENGQEEMKENADILEVEVEESADVRGSEAEDSADVLGSESEDCADVLGSEGEESADVRETGATVEADVRETGATVEADVRETGVTVEADVLETGATVEADVLETGATVEADVLETGATVEADVLETGATVEADVLETGATVEADVLETGATVEADVLETGATVEADVLETGATVEADVLETGATVEADVLETGATVEADVLETGATVEADVLETGATVEADVLETGATVEADVLETGATVEADVLETGATVEADVLETGATVEADVLETGATVEADVLETGATVEADVLETGATVEADVLETGATVEADVLETGATVEADVLETGATVEADVLETGAPVEGDVLETGAPVEGDVLETGAPVEGDVLETGAPVEGDVLETGAPVEGDVLETGAPVEGDVLETGAPVEGDVLETGAPVEGDVLETGAPVEGDVLETGAPVEGDVLETGAPVEGDVLETGAPVEGDVLETGAPVEGDVLETGAPVEGDVLETGAPVEGDVLETGAPVEGDVLETGAPVEGDVLETGAPVEGDVLETDVWEVAGDLDLGTSVDGGDLEKGDK